MNQNKQYDNWDAQEVAEAKKLRGPILIIGVSGFIGSNLFYSLTRHRRRRDVFGCSSNARINWQLYSAKWRHVENIDITNFSQLYKFIKKVNPRTIFNLSAYGGHSDQNNTTKIHAINYIGTLNALKAMPQTCLAFVNAGSSSEYGLNSTAPLETDELIPNSDYAVSKIGASYLIKFYGQIHKIPVIHLRLYSIYGPREGRKRLMPILINNCLKNKWPPLVDKKISHDFVYVDDCTNAFVKAALSLYDKKGIGQAINIATGIRTTMEDLVKIAQQIFKVTTKPVFSSMPNRKWDVKDWYGNPQLAQEILGWKYKTKLTQGLKLEASWMQEFKKTA